MGNAELARTNGELARNYIRNYQNVRGLVPYVVGRFKIVAVRELGPGDVFTSGMVALTNAVDNGELLMEHLYPANPEALPLMKQTLNVGLEIKLERSHDISSVIHAERIGRWPHDDYGHPVALRELYGHTWSGDLSPRAAAQSQPGRRLAIV